MPGHRKRMKHGPLMAADDLFPHFLRQADGGHIAADLAGGIIEDPQGDHFPIIEMFANLGVDTITESLHVQAGVLKRDAYIGPLAVFL